MSSLSRQSDTWLNWPAVVYRCLDADGRLIYIGHTTDLDKRIRAHKSNTPWWPKVARIAATTPRPLRDARTEEARLIRRLRPTFNKRLNPAWYAAGKPVVIEQVA